MLSKKKAIATLFSAVLFCLNPGVVKACLSSDYEYDIFFNRVLEKTYDATFVGQIEVEEIIDDSMVLAILKESETHQNKVGEKFILIHDVTSCGPWLEVGDNGVVMGKSIKTVSGHLYITPYMTSYGLGEFRKIYTDKGSFLTDIP